MPGYDAYAALATCLLMCLALFGRASRSFKWALIYSPFAIGAAASFLYVTGAL